MASDVSETTFENEVIEGSKQTPVLVDFWAEWCGPCHAVSPVLERLVEGRAGELPVGKGEIAENPGRAGLTLGKVTIDESQGLGGRHGVMSIPTMIRCKDGEPAAAASGARPKGD